MGRETLRTNDYRLCPELVHMIRLHPGHTVDEESLGILYNLSSYLASQDSVAESLNKHFYAVTLTVWLRITLIEVKVGIIAAPKKSHPT